MRRQITIMDIEGNMLHNMVINLTKVEHLGASNQVWSINSNCGGPRKDEIVHQLLENEDIVKLDSDSAKAALEEVANHHT
jgi:hypothetical protein